MMIRIRMTPFQGLPAPGRGGQREVGRSAEWERQRVGGGQGRLVRQVRTVSVTLEHPVCPLLYQYVSLVSKCSQIIMEMLKRSGGWWIGCLCLAGEALEDKRQWNILIVGVTSRPVENSTAPEEHREPGVTEPGTGARASGGQARGASPSTVPWQRRGSPAMGWTGETSWSGTRLKCSLWLSQENAGIWICSFPDPLMLIFEWS